MAEAGVLELVETTAGPCYQLLLGVTLDEALAATKAFERVSGKVVTPDGEEFRRRVW